MKRISKFLLCSLAILLCIVGLTGCDKEEEKDIVKVCKSAEKYDVRYQYKFTLDEDGKTIKKISFIQKVNEENLRTVYPDYEIKELYDRFRQDMEYQFDLYAIGNEKLVWFKAMLEENTEKYEATLTFTFDVANEKLDMSDVDTVEWLKEFGVNVFYNNDEKAFIYDEKDFLSRVPLKSIYKVECSEEKDSK